MVRPASAEMLLLTRACGSRAAPARGAAARSLLVRTAVAVSAVKARRGSDQETSSLAAETGATAARAGAAVFVPLVDYVQPFGGGYFYTLPGIAHATDWYARGLLT